MEVSDFFLSRHGYPSDLGVVDDFNTKFATGCSDLKPKVENGTCAVEEYGFRGYTSDTFS